MISANGRLWLARALIGAVLFFNVQSALAFLLSPETYAPGMELGGAPGQAAVRGFGVLFLMWSVPYVVALSDPVRHRISLYEAVAMQAIGLLGESLIFASLPVAHAATRGAITRFIAFDAAGLLALLLAAWLTRPSRPG